MNGFLETYLIMWIHKYCIEYWTVWVTKAGNYSILILAQAKIHAIVYCLLNFQNEINCRLAQVWATGEKGGVTLC